MTRLWYNDTFWLDLVLNKLCYGRLEDVCYISNEYRSVWMWVAYLKGLFWCNTRQQSYGWFCCKMCPRFSTCYWTFRNIWIKIWFTCLISFNISWLYIRCHASSIPHKYRAVKIVLYSKMFLTSVRHIVHGENAYVGQYWFTLYFNIKQHSIS